MASISLKRREGWVVVKDASDNGLTTRGIEIYSTATSPVSTWITLPELTAIYGGK